MRRLDGLSFNCGENPHPNPLPWKERGDQGRVHLAPSAIFSAIVFGRLRQGYSAPGEKPIHRVQQEESSVVGLHEFPQPEPSLYFTRDWGSVFVASEPEV